MERDRVGINIASLAPRAAFDLDWAIKVAKEAGYNWVSVLPFWSCQTPKGLGLPVKTIEEAWNPGDIFDVLRGFRGDPTAPKFQDWGMFPHSKSICRKIFYAWLAAYRKARPVVHGWERFLELRDQGYNPLLEISPGLWQTGTEILGTLEGHGLIGEKVIALDFDHLRRNPRPDEIAKYYGETGGYAPLPEGSMLGRWESAMTELLPCTGLIDFHPGSPKELFATLNGEETELQRMVSLALQEGYEGPWRVEIHLGLLGQLRFGHLAEVLQATREYLIAR